MVRGMSYCNLNAVKYLLFFKINTPEEFALLLVAHFLKTYPQVLLILFDFSR